MGRGKTTRALQANKGCTKLSSESNARPERPVATTHPSQGSWRGAPGRTGRADNLPAHRFQETSPYWAEPGRPFPGPGLKWRRGEASGISVRHNPPQVSYPQADNHNSTVGRCCWLPLHSVSVQPVQAARFRGAAGLRIGITGTWPRKLIEPGTCPHWRSNYVEASHEPEAGRVWSGPDRVRSHRCLDCAWRRDQHEGSFNRDWDPVYVDRYRT